MANEETSLEEKEWIERNIHTLAVLHYQTASLPLNCTLDEFCAATKDCNCPDRLKHRFFSSCRREILALVKQWALESHQKAQTALSIAIERREKQLPINPAWRITQDSGKTWEDEAIEELEQELAVEAYRLKFKNMELEGLT